MQKTYSSHPIVRQDADLSSDASDNLPGAGEPSRKRHFLGLMNLSKLLTGEQSPDGISSRIIDGTLPALTLLVLTLMIDLLIYPIQASAHTEGLFIYFFVILAEQAQLEFLYRADTTKLVIIPPGVDTSRFYPIPKDEAKAAIDLPVEGQMILFVGRIEPLKGVDTLLNALKYIQNSGNLDCCPHYLAIIGGDPEDSEQSLDQEMGRVKALSQELGLTDIVLFLGRRSQDTLPYYYSAADVVVVPSHYESFGMVALEAMACGTPVVASQVGGLAFLVQDGVTGFVVPNGEPELLGQHLIELLLDPQLRARLGSQGAEIARGYSWDTIAARILTLYNSLLDGKNVPHQGLRHNPIV